MLGLSRLSPYPLLSAMLVYACAASSAQLLLLDDNPTTGYQYNTRVVFDPERPHKWLCAGPFVINSRSGHKHLDLDLTYIDGDCAKGVEASLRPGRRAPGSPPPRIAHTRVAGVLLKRAEKGADEYSVSWWNPREERFIEDPERSPLIANSPIILPELPVTNGGPASLLDVGAVLACCAACLNGDDQWLNSPGQTEQWIASGFRALGISLVAAVSMVRQSGTEDSFRAVADEDGKEGAIHCARDRCDLIVPTGHFPKSALIPQHSLARVNPQKGRSGSGPLFLVTDNLNPGKLWTSHFRIDSTCLPAQWRGEYFLKITQSFSRVKQTLEFHLHPFREKTSGMAAYLERKGRPNDAPSLTLRICDLGWAELFSNPSRYCRMTESLLPEWQLPDLTEPATATRKLLSHVDLVHLINLMSNVLVHLNTGTSTSRPDRTSFINDLKCLFYHQPKTVTCVPQDQAVEDLFVHFDAKPDRHITLTEGVSGNCTISYKGGKDAVRLPFVRAYAADSIEAGPITLADGQAVALHCLLHDRGYTAALFAMRKGETVVEHQCRRLASSLMAELASLDVSLTAQGVKGKITVGGDEYALQKGEKAWNENLDALTLTPDESRGEIASSAMRNIHTPALGVALSLLCRAIRREIDGFETLSADLLISESAGQQTRGYRRHLSSVHQHDFPCEVERDYALVPCTDSSCMHYGRKAVRGVTNPWTLAVAAGLTGAGAMLIPAAPWGMAAATVALGGVPLYKATKTVASTAAAHPRALLGSALVVSVGAVLVSTTYDAATS